MEKLKAVIFGRGKYCELKIKSVKNNYEVIAFLDNGVIEPQMDENHNIMVYNPREVLNFQDCKVICMSADFVNMYNQLKDLGVEDLNIEFGVNIEPHYSGMDIFAFSEGQKLSVSNNIFSYYDTDNIESKFETIDEFKELLRDKFRQKNSGMAEIINLPVKPYSRAFGCERGTAVDRIYIEHFLEKHKTDIKGIVMEIASSSYIERFGGDRVAKKHVLHVKGWGKDAIRGNLETGEGLTENMLDCLICTQTLQYIYNLKDTAKNIYNILKPGGVALITVPGIKALSEYDNKNWGEKWSFTSKSLAETFEPVFGSDNVEINSYGNVKIAVAYLYGLCAQDLDSSDFDYNDEMYPFLLTVRVKRR
jgi:SAM-dependent methyltransferase